MKMFYQLIFFAILAVYSSAFRLDLDFMTSDDLERYFSVTTLEEVPEYEIVDPIAYSAGGRHKRHIEIKESTKEIKLKAFGEEFHMKLEENTQLIAEGLQVDVHKEDGTVEKIPLTTTNCFYHGQLLSHEVSTVAVSTCDGLTGMIATDTHDLFIRPLSEEHKEKYRRRRRDVENPHVIYRRNPPNHAGEGRNWCGMDPEYHEAAYMLRESMSEIHRMHAAMAPPPQEYLGDINFDDETTMPTYYEDTTEEDSGSNEYDDDAEGTESNEYDDGSNEATEPNEYDDDAEGTEPNEYDDGSNEATEATEPADGSDEDEDKGRRGESGGGGGGRGHGSGGSKGRADSGGSDPDGGSSRKKRQANGQKYLEVRVLADVDMLNYHGQSGVIQYTLTLMNIVAARYMDPSLGRTIIIHIVRLGYLTSDTGSERAPNGRTVSFNVYKNGVSTLNNWSQYQYATNQWSDNAADHWDHAALITRKNLEINGQNSLLGIAWGNATCYPPRQASASQDQGLSSGIVLAHEIGHSLGMEHDSDNGCVNGKNIMSSSRPNGGLSFVWSSCSRNDLNIFFSDSFKTCLNDQPIGASQYPVDANSRPGSTLSADQQCVLQSTDVQTYVGSCTTNLAGICANLFCRSANGYCSGIVAAAEGTNCGSGRWCISGQCVTNTGSNNNNYEWRVNEGQCSVTCGNGLSTQVVQCFSSSLNTNVDISLCDASTRPNPTTQTCFLGTCPQTNNNWSRVPGPCSTSCGSGTRTDAISCLSPTGQTLADNQCNLATKPTATTSSCFEAECPTAFWQPFPYGSCSVTCGTGTQTRDVWCVISNGRNLVRMPDNQCNQQTKPPTTQQCSNPTSCPNTNVWVTSSFSQCTVTCGGGIRTRTVTCRSSSTSTVILNDSQCQGTKPQSSEACSTQNCPVSPRYTWFATESYGPCSVTCGSGTQSTLTLCVDNQLLVTVDEYLCDINIRPQSTTRGCNTGVSCPSSGSWETGPFSQCDVTCGEGTQQRAVFCTSTYTNAQVSCDPNTKPRTTQSCYNGQCQSGQWAHTQYSSCSVTCGQGIQTRSVYCYSPIGNNQLDESDCDANTKPSTTATCNAGNCPSTNAPDQGIQCAGLWTRSGFNLNRFSFSTNGRLCKEAIVAQPGQTIRLTFNQCYINAAQGDQGFVRDAQNLLPFTCSGNLDDNGQPFVWTSTTHLVQLEHLGQANHGYDVTVEFIGQPSNGCDRVLTAPSGTVTSENYPSNYPNNQRCQTSIMAPPNKRVQMNYQDIRLHNNRLCSDRLEVYDVDSGDGVRYCASPSNVSGLRQPAHDNRVLVQFISNNDGRTSRGFSISYTFVDA
ncbi:A disintegrin and metalloproteinase with thrombospondin motifs 10-like isoform X3 [Amphiura filiformis]|uniref:A disintegrin and metalloproteinase with thrombospondin motifs 10-like isoform X3 n=1 Tax=Amphiura filiformis TaxID=82378 RepID=UPI003B21D16E